MKIAVLTSGGDSPGMNASIRAAARVAGAKGATLVGVEHGYDGLIDGRFRELTMELSGGRIAPLPDVDVIGSAGGTILGSVRSMRFMKPEGRALAAKNLADFAGLIVIGGNGSLTGAHALATEHGVKVIGLPASIDNDIGCSGTAIGVDTALNTIVEACDRISDTARAHRRAFVVEVMGRHCGYLAMASAVAVGADAVMFREQGRGEDALVAAAADVIRRGFAADRGKRRVLIIKAEGVEVPTDRLVKRAQEAIAADLPGIDVRATVLGHLVRGGNPSYQDRMVASRLAYAAVDAILEGKTDEMCAWQPPMPGGATTMDPSVFRFPLDKVLEETKALIDGSSPVTRRRVKMMEANEGTLAL
jgi:6-phosphofructokinase 1